MIFLNVNMHIVLYLRVLMFRAWLSQTNIFFTIEASNLCLVTLSSFYHSVFFVCEIVLI